MELFQYSSDGYESKIFEPSRVNILLLGLGLPYLVRVWKIPLKISLGCIKKYLDQRRVSLLFTAGQKYAWIRVYLFSIGIICSDFNEKS